MLKENRPDLNHLEDKLVRILEVPRTLTAATLQIRQFLSENALTKGQREKLLLRIRDRGILEPLPITWSKSAAAKQLVTAVGEIDPLQLGLAIQPGSYYCYMASLYCLRLTDAPPSIFDLAKERPNYSSTTPVDMSDDALSKEFQKAARISSRTARYKETTFRLLEREESHYQGIISVPSPTDQRISIPTASLERTLVDLAVSPHYVGGFSAAVNIFRTLVPKCTLNVTTLHQTYDALILRYPYWQRLGLMLTISFGKEAASLWKSYFGDPKQRFYADKQADSGWVHDKEWNINYPVLERVPEL